MRAGWRGRLGFRSNLRRNDTAPPT